MLDINELEIYDSLNLTKKLEIPKRSRLFPIKPIGVGTPFVESLISYVIRLAQEHCVTAETLIMGEIEPQIMGQQYDSTLIHKDLKIIFRNKNNRTPAINGMSNLTQLLVSTLENLTLRQDLKFLSCVTWKGIFAEQIANGR